MRLMYSDELYQLLRDVSAQNGGMPLSVFEPPQRYSWSDPSRNFYNSVAYPLPETDEGHSFCSFARQSRALDEMCISCDRRYTDECRGSGRSVIYCCHLGFLEGMIPVSVGGGCACIFLGQVCDEPAEESWPRVWETLGLIDPKYFTADRRDEFRDIFMTRQCFISEKRFGAVFSMLKLLSSRLTAIGWVTPVDADISQMLNSYIDQHIGEPMTSAQVCARLGFSRTTLYRAVKERYGVGFNSYVNRCKIGRAKDMLRRSASVKETALALGYVDVGYFSRLFKTHTGVSPSEYARSGAGAPVDIASKDAASKDGGSGEDEA